MPITARQARGRATNQMVARWFAGNGWPYATAVTGAATGRDVMNMPGLAPEVKATSAEPMLTALKQARANAGDDDVPFVVWRPNGYGSETLADFVVALRLSEFTRLLRLAGYGDPLPNQDTA
jgi:hypothetical protein